MYTHIIFERIYLSLMDGKLPILYFSIFIEAVMLLLNIFYLFQIDIFMYILIDLSGNFSINLSANFQ
jgi:hypothetical protein